MTSKAVEHCIKFLQSIATACAGDALHRKISSDCSSGRLLVDRLDGQMNRHVTLAMAGGLFCLLEGVGSARRYHL